MSEEVGCEAKGLAVSQDSCRESCEVISSQEDKEACANCIGPLIPEACYKSPHVRSCAGCLSVVIGAAPACIITALSDPKAGLDCVIGSVTTLAPQCIGCVCELVSNIPIIGPIIAGVCSSATEFSQEKDKNLYYIY